MFGTTPLVLRSTASLVQTGYFIAVGQFRFALMGVREWWFHAGAILFVLSTWRLRRMVRGRGEERKDGGTGASRMKCLAVLVAGIFILIGLAGLVIPDWLAVAARSAITPVGLILIGALRVAMGLVLILAAPISRVPRTLRVFGAVLVVAGLATPVFGVDRSQRVADWGIAQGPMFVRGVGVVILAVGGLVGLAMAAGRQRQLKDGGADRR